MARVSKLGIFGLVIAAALISVPGLRAQQAPGAVAAAQVPPQIAAAKKVFISNAGVDGGSLAAFRAVGDPDLPYNTFYSMMKSLGAL